MAREFTKEKKLYLYSLITNKHTDFYATFVADVTKLLNSNGPGINYDNPTLVYGYPDSKWISSKLMQFIVTKTKSNPLIRKIAIKVKHIYKKRYA